MREMKLKDAYLILAKGREKEKKRKEGNHHDSVCCQLVSLAKNMLSYN
jgi:hypothetical protein